MGTPWPARQKLIKELVEGQECATQLKSLLHRTVEDQGSPSAQGLVLKILRSFTETLSVLSSSESGEGSQNPVLSHADSHCDDRRSGDTGESSRKRPASKDRRGCYRRRKVSHTWTIVSPTMDDGHAWRKYGQKEILHAKHPRSYFRCTRKYDQGCRATKQVQRMEDDPKMFQTTYIGHHTCRDMLKAPQIVAESYGWESFPVNSEAMIPSTQDPALSSSTPTVKQESKEEALSDLTDNLSSLGTNLWSDLNDFELSGPAIISPKIGSDTGDVVSTLYSCTDAGSLGLDMDFGVKPVDFDSDFNFDDGEFL